MASTAQLMKNDAEARRQQSMQRFVQLLQQRGEKIRAQQQKMENDLMAQEQAMAEQERLKKLDWSDDLMKGAQMGSAAGPWGALVGGIIGTIKGQVESVRTRMDEGESGGKAFLKTHFDFPGVNLGSLMAGEDGKTALKESTHWRSMSTGEMGNMLGGAFNGAMANKNMFGGGQSGVPEMQDATSGGFGMRLSNPGADGLQYGDQTMNLPPSDMSQAFTLRMNPNLQRAKQNNFAFDYSDTP